MEHAPHRREVILGGLGAAGIALVTADQVDTTSAEYGRITRELDAVAEQWEQHGPQTSLARLYTIHNRLTMAGKANRDWAALGALALIMVSEAELATGDERAAGDTARLAWDAARLARHPVHQAHAIMITATIASDRDPDGLYPVQQLYAASVGADRSPVGVAAATLEAQAAAARGSGVGDARTIQAILGRAEEMQSRLPAVSGWPAWTPAHLHAFGALALIRAGSLGMASEWLGMAEGEASGQPGLGVVISLYRAKGYEAAEDWPGAHAYAKEALDLAAPRGIPAWLSIGIDGMARHAVAASPAAAGEWAPLQAAAAA